VGKAWGSHCRGPWSPTEGSRPASVPHRRRQRGMRDTDRQTVSVHYMMMQLTLRVNITDSDLLLYYCDLTTTMLMTTMMACRKLAITATAAAAAAAVAGRLTGIQR